MKTLLFNASNIRHGGGIQVAIALLMGLCRRDSIKIVAYLTSAVAEQLHEDLVLQEIYVSPYSSNSLFAGYTTRQSITKRCAEGDIDVCLTVFGPTLIRSKIPHIMGFANSWVATKEIAPFDSLPVIERAMAKTKYFAYEFLLRRFAGRFVVETEFVKSGMVKKGICDGGRVEVVGNTYSFAFRNYRFDPKPGAEPYYFSKEEGYTYFFVLAHDYAHKNLNVIEPVYDLLQRDQQKVKFVTTIPENNFSKKSNLFKEACINLGAIQNSDCPPIYELCDALFLPTLLECFSASYPEAMVMGKPILTSDRGFAREICGSSAIYFDPLSAADIAKKIAYFKRNCKIIAHDVPQAYKSILEEMETPQSRVDKYLQLVEEVTSVDSPRWIH